MFFRRAATARSPVPNYCPVPLSATDVPGPCTEPISLAPVPVSCPLPVSSSPVPAPRPRKTAAKRAQIFRLVLEPLKSPAEEQAAKILAIIREEVPDAKGQWLIVADLSKTYREIAQQEGWPELRWAAIGRELGKLTKRKTIKKDGKRHVAYLLR